MKRSDLIDWKLLKEKRRLNSIKTNNRENKNRLTHIYEVGDKVFRHVDPMGNPCKELHRWTIAETQNADKLGIGDLCVGREYEIYVKREKTVQPFKLSEVDLYTRTYSRGRIQWEGE